MSRMGSCTSFQHLPHYDQVEEAPPTCPHSGWVNTRNLNDWRNIRWQPPGGCGGAGGLKRLERRSSGCGRPNTVWPKVRADSMDRVQMGNRRMYDEQLTAFSAKSNDACPLTRIYGRV
jgi:hypothetical protein